MNSDYIKNSMIESIFDNLKRRNLSYSELCLLNRIISNIKLKKYDDILDEICDLKVVNLLCDKLELLKKRSF